MVMNRYVLGAASALLIAGPVFAADVPHISDCCEFRPSYEPEWETGMDSLRFELGARYWYSWGAQDASFASPYGPIDLTVRDQTQIGEIHGRIDDLHTSTYLKAMAGLGFATTGTYDISPAAGGNIGGASQIGYVGADYGYMPLGEMDGPFAGGGFLGYTYWRDAPDIGSGQIATGFDFAGNPTEFASAPDSLDIHALRLGLRGTAEFDMFDFQAEVAAVPYAHVSGALGGSAPDGFTFDGVPVPVYENAQTTLSGRGYGVMAETMVGFHPTENITVRLGGRAWYLQGELEAKFNGTAGGAAQPEETLTSTTASVFRYGLLAELTGRF
jgi:hypothetical protein